MTNLYKGCNFRYHVQTLEKVFILDEDGSLGWVIETCLMYLLRTVRVFAMYLLWTVRVFAIGTTPPTKMKIWRGEVGQHLSL